jgi:hypothetical protein
MCICQSTQVAEVARSRNMVGTACPSMGTGPMALARWHSGKSPACTSPASHGCMACNHGQTASEHRHNELCPLIWLPSIYICLIYRVAGCLPAAHPDYNILWAHAVAAGFTITPATACHVGPKCASKACCIAGASCPQEPGESPFYSAVLATKTLAGTAMPCQSSAAA